MPGRSTFTATLRPSIRVAGWACAREAAAMAGPNALNRASSGWPSALTTWALA
jgi:hypothetical protein